MTKRAFQKFERKEQDFYPTPEAAVLPLMPFLKEDDVRTFAEPCYGDGSLAAALTKNGLRCLAHGDLRDEIGQDARTWAPEDFNGADVVITNPPWKHPYMYDIMLHLSYFTPAWFLIYWDWLSNKQAAPLIKERCTDVVPIGRVKWIPDSPTVGYDNVCWVRMWANKRSATRLWPRDWHDLKS